mmetsp:Transcript_11937/g.49800  ORF Transcript_11937/g.49800 Transcript_11937/m.49800 type:complete len:142 (-) Transcript_11937:508-933(-)
MTKKRFSFGNSKTLVVGRFWFLETVARMPYFAYLSVLHLYETFGWWHVSELRKIHFAEDWNELHHLLIMESLGKLGTLETCDQVQVDNNLTRSLAGGDSVWSDRFLASHAALVYYWCVNDPFFYNPRTRLLTAFSPSGCWC